jgi:hypothetical protein
MHLDNSVLVVRGDPRGTLVHIGNAVPELQQDIELRPHLKVWIVDMYQACKHRASFQL